MRIHSNLIIFKVSNFKVDSLHIKQIELTSKYSHSSCLDRFGKEQTHANYGQVLMVGYHSTYKTKTLQISCQKLKEGTGTGK